MAQTFATIAPYTIEEAYEVADAIERDDMAARMEPLLDEALEGLSEENLKAEIDQVAWESLHSDTSRPFPKPKSKRIAVKVINHLGDEVMRVFKVD